MINENSLRAVEEARFSQSFCRPLYDSYCFFQIPSTIEALFTGDYTKGLPQDVYPDRQAYDQVILLFIDGFGWRFFEQYLSQFPFLEEKGIASKITSMFPSTTAAHVTGIHTGTAPAESGIYEWFMYEPKLNEIIAPLPYCFAGDKKPNSLPLNPEIVFPKQTLYQKLSSMGISSHAFQPEGIRDSCYSRAILAGASVHGYRDPKEALDQIFAPKEEKTYSYFYYGDIDAVGHRKGITSREFTQKVEEIFTLIGQYLEKIPPKTAVIITADHGMTEIDPKTTYYLNHNIPGIEKYFRYGERGKPLTPAGSPRDYFLHIKDEYEEEVRDILTEFLQKKAEIYRIEELVELGFFGPEAPSENFRSRVGNLAILPYKGESIWWYEKGRFEQNFYAAHGGLTRDEMETIFLIYEKSSE